MMAAILGLIIGVIVGIFVKPDIPIVLQPYLPIMVVAALDALLGAARSYFERSFSDRVFVISFISNVLIATLLVLLGNQLGVGSQLQTAVIVVLGIRIFSNVSAIRRFIFKG
jgi:small basic protein